MTPSTAVSAAAKLSCIPRVLDQVDSGATNAAPTAISQMMSIEPQKYTPNLYDIKTSSGCNLAVGQIPGQKRSSEQTLLVSVRFRPIAVITDFGNAIAARRAETGGIMFDLSKTENRLLIVTVLIQLALLRTVAPTIAIVLPPLIAAIPIALVTLRSEQTVKMMARRIRRSYVSLAVFVVGAVALFILLDPTPSFKLHVLQALLVDCAVLWLATIVAVQVHTLRRRA